MPGKSYTVNELKEVARLYTEEGYTGKEASKTLGRSVYLFTEAVKRGYIDAPIVKGKSSITAEELKEAERLYHEEGLSGPTVCARLGRAGSLFNKAKQLGYIVPRSKPEAAQKGLSGNPWNIENRYPCDEINSYFKAGYSYEQVSRLFNIDKSTLIQMKNKGLIETNPHPTGRVYDQLDWDMIQEFYDQGYSLKETADQFSISTMVLRSAAERGDFRIRPFQQAITLALKQGKYDGARWPHGPSQGELCFKNLLDQHLPNTGYQMEYRIGRYRADFCWPHLGKIIEIDGDQHHRYLNQMEHDIERDEHLTYFSGYEILRVPAENLKQDPENWIQKVRQFLNK